MKRIAAIAVSAFLLSTPAVADEAMDKCLADTTALGATDSQMGCECFIERISGEEADAYAKITDWASEASDEMKDAGAACFPELQ